MKSPWHRRGSMMVEFVLVMPILFMLIMGVLQFAQIMTARQFVAYAAFCSARSMLCSNPTEWALKNSKNNCAYQAARRALSWVTLLGTSETSNLRGVEEEELDFGVNDFVDIGIDLGRETYTTTMYGDSATHDVIVPGWGQVPESNSVDIRLNVTSGVSQGKCVWSKVQYKFPLVFPVVGQMISWFAKGNSYKDSRYLKNNNLAAGGWTGEEELLDGVPYIELTETCVLPMPYSSASLPGNPFGVGSAFDYTTYD